MKPAKLRIHYGTTFYPVCGLPPTSRVTVSPRKVTCLKCRQIARSRRRKHRRAR